MEPEYEQSLRGAEAARRLPKRSYSGAAWVGERRDAGLRPFPSLPVSSSLAQARRGDQRFTGAAPARERDTHGNGISRSP